MYCTAWEILGLMLVFATKFLIVNLIKYFNNSKNRFQQTFSKDALGLWAREQILCGLQTKINNTYYNILCVIVVNYYFVKYYCFLLTTVDIKTNNVLITSILK